MIRLMKYVLCALFVSAACLCSATGTDAILNAHPDPKYGKPIPFRKVPGTAGTMSLEIANGKLYALEDNGLSIFDISDSKSPKRLGHVGGMGNVRQLRISGKTAFLSSRQCGLWAVDISDSASPRIISNFDGVEMATGLDVAGDVAFLGNRVYGIQCVDVSDPAKMKHLSSLRTDESQSVYYRNGLLMSGDWAGGEVTVGDGVLYISGNFTGLYIAELPGIAKPEPRDFGALPTLPAKPFDHHEEGFVSSGAQLSNPTRAVAINGDIAYAANVWEGVKIYRLSEGKIEQIGRANIPYAADVKRSGDRLYVAEGPNGVGVYKIVSDTELKEISRFTDLDTPPHFAQFVWAFDGHDVIATSSGSTCVLFIDFADLANPERLLRQHGGCLVYNNYGGQSLVKDKYFGFSRVFGGIQIFEIGAGSAKLIWEDTFPMCSQTGTLAAFGGEFLVMRCGGYAFLDPENPVGVRDLKRYPFPTSAGLPADIPDGSAISRAMFPKSEFEGQVNADESSRRVAIANRMFKNIKIYDFSNRENPKLLKSAELHANPNVPAFWKGRVVLPGGYSGLLLERRQAH